MVKNQRSSTPVRPMPLLPILFHVIIRVQASIDREENSINTPSHTSTALLQPVKIPLMLRTKYASQEKSAKASQKRDKMCCRNVSHDEVSSRSHLRKCFEGGLDCKMPTGIK